MGGATVKGDQERTRREKGRRSICLYSTAREKRSEESFRDIKIKRAKKNSGVKLVKGLRPPVFI